MNHKLFRSFLTMLVAILVLSACGSIASGDLQSSGSSVVDGCIAPPEMFAYSVQPDPNKPQSPATEPMTLPPSPWQEQTSLPQIASDLTARSINGHTEIWVTRNPYNPSGPEIHEFMVYYPENSTWETISAAVGNDGGYVGKLFEGEEGDLWGQNFGDIHQSPTGQENVVGQSILSKYNDQTKQFEFEDETLQFTNAQMDADKVPYKPEILLDSQGVFWIFVHKEAIYTYNPTTKETTHIIDIPDQIVTKPTLAPDGSIYYINQYYLEHGLTRTINDKEIFHLLPESGTVEKIPVQLEPWPTFSNILVDQSDRLWLDSLGWREANGIWYQVHRSPIFITNVLWSGMDYRWKTPLILMESSDGRLWFRSDNGMTWLNPQKGQWCWFTTEQSNIVDDQQDSLWMVADNKLFKLDMEP